MVLRAFGVLVIVAAVSVGCKSGGGSPTQPTNPGGGTPPPSGGNPPPGGSTQTNTMTINASGVLTPNDITVAVGSRVTIVNNHNRQHEMNSDQHPDHLDCPAINDVGFLSSGQSKLTGNLTTIRTCGIHDHNEPDNPNLVGRIRIQ